MEHNLLNVRFGSLADTQDSGSGANGNLHHVMRLGALMFAWLALGVGMFFTGPASHFFGGVRMAWAHFNIEEYGAMFLVVAGLAPCVLGSSRKARDHRNA